MIDPHPYPTWSADDQKNDSVVAIIKHKGISYALGFEFDDWPKGLDRPLDILFASVKHQLETLDLVKHDGR